MDDFHAKFGQLVHDWREAASKTKKEAAALADVSDTTWLAVEAGKGAADRTLGKVSKVVWGDPAAWRQIQDGAEPPPFMLPEVVSLDAQLALVNEKLTEVLRRLDERDEREARQ